MAKFHIVLYNLVSEIDQNISDFARENDLQITHFVDIITK